MQQVQKLAFIGGGNASTALIAGLRQSGWASDAIMVADPGQAQRDKLGQNHGVLTTADNLAAVEFGEIVLLAIKPQIAAKVIRQLRPQLCQRRPLIISLVAGLSCQQIENWLGQSLAIVRMMPNTPAMLGASASGLYGNTATSTDQRAQVQRIAEAFGIGIWVERERLMDVVTAVAGSGPAYFYLTIEALQEAAQAIGLPADSAQQLITQTALGAARMVQQTGESPARLRQRVTSPGGTTECAMESLEGSGLKALFAEAVRAALGRADQLATHMEGCE